jgi:hypothetical protein
MAPTYDDGLILDHPPSDLESVPPPPFLAYADKPQYGSKGAPIENPRTICGMRRITFLLLAIIVVLVIAGAVGGGVGGSLAVKNAQNSENNVALNSASTSPLAVTASSSLGTTVPLR